MVHRARSDRGTAVATVVVLAPVFVLLLLFVVHAGQIAVARQAVISVSRDAARAAAVGVESPTGEHGQCLGGMSIVISDPLPQRASQVEAVATCQVGGGDILSLLGVGTVTIEGRSTAWVDEFRSDS